MKRPQFHCADGTLTVYAFRCGYVQRIDRDKGAAELYMEHGCYHVRRFDYLARDNGAPLSTWRVWDSFPAGESAAARKRYRAFARIVRKAAA